MSETTVKSCGACHGRSEMFLCWECAKQLRWKLVGRDNEPGIAWYIGRLQEAAYRQAKLTRGPQNKATKPASEFSLLPDKRATDLLEQIYALLEDWAHKITVDDQLPIACNPLAGHDARYRPTAIEYAHYIAYRIVAVMAVEESFELEPRLRDLQKQAHNCINPPPDEYCGPCPTKIDDKQCGADLRVNRGENTVTCRRCKTDHEVLDVRLQALDRVAAEPRPAHELLKLLPMLGHKLPPRSTFYAMVSRLTPRMYLHADSRRNQRFENGAVALYAYGDVVNALTASTSTLRRRDRSKRKAAV